MPTLYVDPVCVEMFTRRHLNTYRAGIQSRGRPTNGATWEVTHVRDGGSVRMSVARTEACGLGPMSEASCSYPASPEARDEDTRPTVHGAGLRQHRPFGAGTHRRPGGDGDRSPHRGGTAVRGHDPRATRRAIFRILRRRFRSGARAYCCALPLPLLDWSPSWLFVETGVRQAPAGTDPWEHGGIYRGDSGGETNRPGRPPDPARTLAGLRAVR